MSAPRATMRLQFHKGFTFDDAVPHAPYLAELGISHLYASPILTARAGSMHGYDVVDPTRVNPELGGEPAFRRLVHALRSAGIGIIVDIVPNHMAVGTGNRWWLDVLQHGIQSRYARYFDIDWDCEDPTLRRKILLPVLGRPYGEALAHGEIVLAFNIAEDRYEARYFDHIFPIRPDDRGGIERLTLEAFDAAAESGRRRLHGLLERQHFRLAWWRVATTRSTGAGFSMSTIWLRCRPTTNAFSKQPTRCCCACSPRAWSTDSASITSTACPTRPDIAVSFARAWRSCGAPRRVAAIPT
jgi:maltooligosyltrehalose synthase